MSVQTVAPGVHVVSLGFPNAVVLEDDNGPIIVDTGWPKSEDKIVDALKEIGLMRFYPTPHPTLPFIPETVKTTSS